MHGSSKQRVVGQMCQRQLTGTFLGEVFGARLSCETWTAADARVPSVWTAAEALVLSLRRP